MSLNWLSRILSISLRQQRRVIVRQSIYDSYDLQVCVPKIIRRSRPLWLSDRLDSYHLLEDGNIHKMRL